MEGSRMVVLLRRCSRGQRSQERLERTPGGPAPGVLLLARVQHKLQGVHVAVAAVHRLGLVVPGETDAVQPVSERPLTGRSRRRHRCRNSVADPRDNVSFPGCLSVEPLTTTHRDQPLQHHSFVCGSHSNHHNISLTFRDVGDQAHALSQVPRRCLSDSGAKPSRSRRRTQHGERRARSSSGAAPRPTTLSEARRSMHAEILPMRLFLFFFFIRERTLRCAQRTGTEVRTARTDGGDAAERRR